MHTPGLLRPFEVVIWGEDKTRPLSRLMVSAFSEDEAKDNALWQYDASLGIYQGSIVRKDINDARPIRVTRVDVCDGVRVTPHQRQRGLFEDLAEVCLGSSMDDVQGAAVNLLLTAVQRRASNQADAERRWDELMGRGKQALIRRYRGDTDARDKAAESDIAKKLFA